MLIYLYKYVFKQALKFISLFFIAVYIIWHKILLSDAQIAPNNNLKKREGLIKEKYRKKILKPLNLIIARAKYNSYFISVVFY